MDQNKALKPHSYYNRTIADASFQVKYVTVQGFLPEQWIAPMF